MASKEKHHAAGPSSLGRIMECPGSLALCKNEPELQTDDAIEGTTLHRAVERHIVGDPDWSKGLDVDQQDLVIDCVEFIDEVAPGAEVYAEHKVTLSDGRGIINFGRADVIAIVPGRKIVIIDFKFGRKIKESALVLQLANYAAAAAQSFPPVRACSELPIEAWAFFPRLGVRLKWEAMTAEEAIHMVAPSVREVIRRAEAPDAPVRPGPHCEYCRHMPNCAVLRETGQRALADVSADRLLADPARAVELYDLGLVVEKQAKALRGAIREILAQDPDALPGLELAEVGGRRTVEDAEELKKRLMASGKFSALDWMRALEPSVPALERAWLEKFYQGRGNGKPTQKAIKGEFAAVAGDAVKKGTTKTLRRVQ